MSSPFKTFTCYTFGCKVNFADSSTISRSLMNLGYSYVNTNELADIYIINTCSVTEKADLKAKKMINQLYKKSPKSKIIVTGCYAQLQPEEILNLPGVDLVIGAQDKFDIKKYILNDESKRSSIENDINNVNKFNISYSLSERTRAFVKIQDGCNYNCSYCTIPFARGLTRNDSISKTINKIKDILAKGSNEIVLSGINLGDFGNQTNESFYSLLKEIEKIENLKRYRISSIEPNLLTEEIINLLSHSKKWAQHLHIPLQSGSDKILRKMKRRYTTNDYSKLINILYKKNSNVSIGIDVIVGFPSESDDDFIKTYNFIKHISPSYLHVFSYSKRKNTEAASYKKQIDFKTINSRRKKLQQLSNMLHLKYINKNIGLVRPVLFEKYENGLLQGLTDNYIKVFVPDDEKFVNKIIDVKIVKYEEFVFGEIVE